MRRADLAITLPCSWLEAGVSVMVLDLFCGSGRMLINNWVKLIEALGALDMKLVALGVIALAIIAVVIIVNGFGR